MYRDEHAAARHLLSTHPHRRQSLDLLGLLAHRRARIAAGVVGVAGAALTWAATVAAYQHDQGQGDFHGLLDDVSVPAILLGSWPAALLVWLVTFVLTNDLRVGAPKQRRAGRDPWLEVKHRQQDARSETQLRQSIERLGVRSRTWLAWLFCLLAPLTLQTLYLGLFDDKGSADPIAGRPPLFLSSSLDRTIWIQKAVALTWLPHLVLCVLARRYCIRLDDAPETGSWKTANIHLATAAVSALPSAFFFVAYGNWDSAAKLLIGTGIVGAASGIGVYVTGLLFLPSAYKLVRRIHQREKAILDLPR